MKKTVKITFVTPCFCRGADCSDTGKPEIRPASIRGQLRWWFRALGGGYEEEIRIFGGIKKEPKASRVMTKVFCKDIASQSFATLPHKSGGRAASKMAVPPGFSFELRISTRLGGLSEKEERDFDRTLNAWLLMGSLGLRTTRGGGNFRYEGQPGSEEAYQAEIDKVTAGTPFRAELSTSFYRSAEEARRVITDTLAFNAFERCRFPLGCIRPWRKTSPLRFRVVEFARDRFFIVVGWDGRKEVTGNELFDLDEAARILRGRRKPIGDVLEDIRFIQS